VLVWLWPPTAVTRAPRPPPPPKPSSTFLAASDRRLTVTMRSSRPRLAFESEASSTATEIFTVLSWALILGRLSGSLGHVLFSPKRL
jgi:hypothetical protein